MKRKGVPRNLSESVRSFRASKKPKLLRQQSSSMPEMQTGNGKKVFDLDQTALFTHILPCRDVR